MNEDLVQPLAETNEPCGCDQCEIARLMQIIHAIENEISSAKQDTGDQCRITLQKIEKLCDSALR